MFDFSDYNFAKVMDYPEVLHPLDLTRGYDPEFIRKLEWGIGRYDEKRKGMYEALLFDNRRYIHVGIDIWAPAGEPVYSFFDGEVAYIQNNDQAGDYGPTIVINYKLGENNLHALYGHLSVESLSMVSVGDHITKGQKIAELGDEEVNGGWVPHLHFQLSVEDPGEADMPGVVAPEDRKQALKKYPHPRIVLGDFVLG